MGYLEFCRDWSKVLLSREAQQQRRLCHLEHMFPNGSMQLVAVCLLGITKYHDLGIRTHGSATWSLWVWVQLRGFQEEPLRGPHGKCWRRPVAPPAIDMFKPSWLWSAPHPLAWRGSRYSLKTISWGLKSCMIRYLDPLGTLTSSFLESLIVLGCHEGPGGQLLQREREGERERDSCHLADLIKPRGSMQL